MEIQTTLADSCDIFADVEVIARIRPVRYSKIQIPSGNRIVLVARDKRTVERLLKEKRRWIKSKLTILREMEASAEVGRSEFYYFGKPRGLDGMESAIKQARKDLLSYASAYLEQNTPVLPKIKVRRMHARLGVYSAKKDEIRLSSYLAFLPQALIDYIIFHELTHRDVRGHGRNFWKKIKERYHDCREKEKELDLWWLRVKKQIEMHKELKYV